MIALQKVYHKQWCLYHTAADLFICPACLYTLVKLIFCHFYSALSRKKWLFCGQCYHNAFKSLKSWIQQLVSSCKENLAHFSPTPCPLKSCFWVLRVFLEHHGVGRREVTKIWQRNLKQVGFCLSLSDSSSSTVRHPLRIDTCTILFTRSPYSQEQLLGLGCRGLQWGGSNRIILVNICLHVHLWIQPGLL